jgi:hypothetical protein
VQSLATDCPSPAQVESALGRVLGPGDNAAWVLTYGSTPASATQAPSVWMSLFDPNGQRAAHRQFAPDRDCAALASAMAAVVERSLHALGWTRGEPLPDGVPPQEPLPQAPEPLRLPRLTLGLGPAIGTAADMGTNLELDARVLLAGAFSLRAGGELLANEATQTIGGGRASKTGRHLTLGVLSTLLRRRLHLDAGLVVLLGIDRAKTEGLSEPATGWRASVAVGLLLGAGARFSRRWRIAAGIEGLRAVAHGDYVVQLDQRRALVLAPSTWQAVAYARLEFVAWP